jgi:alpha-1,2-mannosyltransferase
VLTRPFSRRDVIASIAGLAVFTLLVSGVVYRYLLDWPGEIWQVDLEVYREGARSLLEGREVYQWRTGGPQWLPFTYPPFAALLGIPLALMSFGFAAWVWALLQLALIWVSVGIAFRPVTSRAGVWSPVLQGAIAGTLVHVLPLSDLFRFGQVNAVIVTLCLVDVTRRTQKWWPRGSLVAVATAIKLTPAVFWIHWAVTRRWRPLIVSIGTAAGITAITFLLLPAASAAFWTDALLDPDRLGPNQGAANQSMRGVLLRLGPGEGPALTMLWLALILLVGVAGFALSARLDRLGEQVAVVGVVGMLAVLISPVSWVHHLFWGIVVIGAVVGDGRDWRRVLTGAAGTLWLYLHMPWWGASMVQRGQGPAWWARLLENSYALFAVLSLVAIWWFVARDRGRRESEPAEATGREGRTESASSLP